MRHRRPLGAPGATAAAVPPATDAAAVTRLIAPLSPTPALTPATTPVEMPQVTILGEAAGRFGALLVADVDDWRGLWAGDRCQGSAFIDPPLAVDGMCLRPGTVPEASYLLAWLLPVCCDPTGRILMGGLGSGVGATTLLSQCPQLHLTVIEIDEEVIQLALTHFPALRHYQAIGRCEIVAGDVSEVVTTWRGEPWRMALLDTFQHDDRLYCPAGLLGALHRHVAELWVNVVDGAEQLRVTRLQQRLNAQRWRPRCLITAFDIDAEGAFPSENYLIGTRGLDPAGCARFVPFADSQHPRAQQAQQSYTAMVDQLQDL